MKPIIHHDFSRRWLGVGMSLVAALAVQASTDVTVQIDMASVSPAPTAVYISGSFNGWPGPATPVSILHNVSGTIWSNTFTITDAPGTVESCKFQYEPGDNWEGDPNRQFVVGPAGPAQVLPLTSWNVKDWPAPTNQVTFQVDLSPQVITGTFTNGPGTITVSGDFEGWDAGLPMTNNPAAPNLASNIYSGTFPVIGFPPTVIHYKFRADGGWEDDQPTATKNRESTIDNATQVLPLVFYNNASLVDLMTSPTLVTFSLHITNGTPDNGGSPYIKGFDKLYINGNFFAHDSSGTVVPAGTGGYWTWNVLSYPASTGPASAEMVESAIPDVYTNSFLLPKGSGLKVVYKYSQDGFDDENGFQTNHVRYVRSYPPSYVFPRDVWSFVVPPPYPNSILVEPDFGNLVITGTPHVPVLPITWLGRPGVILQNNSSLTGGSWIDNNGTDAMQATNWPNTGSAQFFRLKKNP
jgi:hypothetical protein